MNTTDDLVTMACAAIRQRGSREFYDASPVILAEFMELNPDAWTPTENTTGWEPAPEFHGELWRYLLQNHDGWTKAHKLGDLMERMNEAVDAIRWDAMFLMDNDNYENSVQAEVAFNQIKNISNQCLQLAHLAREMQAKDRWDL
jgi:hypothetical protein